MEIREATIQDATAVQRLAVQLRDEDDAALPPLSLEWVEEYLLADQDIALLAEIDGAAVGLLTYRLHADLFHGGQTAVIEELVVDESARGKGVGTALLEESIRRAREAGCVEIAVNTGFDNAGAQALYRRMGFTNESLMLGTHFVDQRRPDDRPSEGTGPEG